MDVSEIHVSHSSSEPSINNHSKSIGKNQRRLRRPRRSSNMVQGLKELFNQAKTIEKGNGSGVEDAKLQSCIHLLNDMGLVADMYSEAVQHFLNVPSARTTFFCYA